MGAREVRKLFVLRSRNRRGLLSPPGARPGADIYFSLVGQLPAGSPDIEPLALADGNGKPPPHQDPTKRLYPLVRGPLERETSDQAIRRYVRQNPDKTGLGTFFFVISIYSDKPPTASAFVEALKTARQSTGRDGEPDPFIDIGKEYIDKLRDQ